MGSFGKARRRRRNEGRKLRRTSNSWDLLDSGHSHPLTRVLAADGRAVPLSSNKREIREIVTGTTRGFIEVFRYGDSVDRS